MSANPTPPDNAELKRRRDALRRQLAQAKRRHVRLTQHTGPELEALYQQRFGALELALLQAQADNVRRRRKLELLQAAISDGDQLSRRDLLTLERRLDDELHEWQRRLSQREDELEWARRYLASDLIHGPVDSGPVPEENGDAETDVPGLARENEYLLQHLRKQLRRTAELEGQEPFCYAPRLKDRLWIARRQVQLKEEIEQQQIIAERLDALLATLLAAPRADAA